MLTDKQIRMVGLLDDQMRQCTKCGLHRNGRCKPYLGFDVKYAIIGEAPGYNEVRDNEPFTGPAGEVLWNIMNSQGLYKKDFFIINSVNCRPVDEHKTWKNGKPTEAQQHFCKPWIRKYLNVLKPEGVLVLGNYAMHTVTGSNTGIMSLNGTVLEEMELDPSFRFNIPYVLSVHPALCIYRKEEGRQMLSESISKFKNTAKPKDKPKQVFDFLEDEELWKI